MEIWRFSVAADTKRWSFAGPKAANLLPHDAGEDGVDLYGGIATSGDLPTFRVRCNTKEP